MLLHRKTSPQLEKQLSEEANSTFALEFAIDTDRALFQELIEKGADKDVALQILVFRLLELKGIKYYNRFYRPEIDSLNAEPFYADVIMKMTTAYSSGYPDYTGFMDPYKTYTLGKLTSLKDTLLLKKLAPINPTRALPIAIKLRMNKFINQLLEIGASKDLALYFACEEEDEPLIRRLIASGARLKFRSKIAFSKNEKLKSILAPVTDGKPFSEHPNDGSAEDSSSIPSLLFKAIRQDNFSAVKFMLDAGADPNALMHFYDVSWALSSSIPELEESRLIDCEGISPLWISKYMEKKFGVNGKITKLLLTKGAKLSNKECLPQIETFRY